MAKIMNHSVYPRQMKTKTEAELRFIVKDAREAAEANPTGENCGYYLDEVHYAAAEMRMRRGNN